MRTFSFLVTDGTLDVKSFLGFILGIIIENILGDVVNYIIMTIFILNLPLSLTTDTVYTHTWNIKNFRHGRDIASRTGHEIYLQNNGTQLRPLPPI